MLKLVLVFFCFNLLSWVSLGEEVLSSSKKIELKALTFPHPKPKKKPIVLQGQYEVVHVEAYQLRPEDSIVTIFFDSRLPHLHSNGLSLPGIYVPTQLLKMEIQTASGSEARAMVQKIEQASYVNLTQCKDFVPQRLKFSYYEKYPLVARCKSNKVQF